MDNASNNATFMYHFSILLAEAGNLDFDAKDNYIRCFGILLISVRKRQSRPWRRRTVTRYILKQKQRLSLMMKLHDRLHVFRVEPEQVPSAVAAKQWPSSGSLDSVATNC
jgi:hypothetical protein